MADRLVPIWVPESEYASALQKLYGSRLDEEIAELQAQRSKVPSRSREYGRLSAAILRKRRSA